MRTSKKCHKCGLVNFGGEVDCRRCQADLDAPQQIPQRPVAKSYKSTIYLGLFVLLLVGFGVWAYKYKTESDKELKAKAEFYGRQNDYAGHDVNTIPAPGAPTPTPQPYRAIRPEDQKRMEELRKEMDFKPYTPPVVNPSPTPSWVP
jgi:hypothetical protein